MNAETGTRSLRRPRIRVLYAVIVVAVLFAAAVVVQFLLAGLALFESGGYWEDHTTLGHSLLPLALALPILAAIGRAGRRLIGLSVIIAVLYFVQTILPTLTVGVISALHPIVGAALLWMALDLASEVRRVVRASTASGAPASHELATEPGHAATARE